MKTKRPLSFTVLHTLWRIFSIFPYSNSSFFHHEHSGVLDYDYDFWRGPLFLYFLPLIVIVRYLTRGRFLIPDWLNVLSLGSFLNWVIVLDFVAVLFPFLDYVVIWKEFG